MDYEILRCEYEDIKDLLIKHINSFHSLFDSFVEEHLLDSNFYKILINGNDEGYFSIRNKSILTSFYINIEYRKLSQEIFNKIRRYEEVQKALIFTGDEFYLSHALDYSKRIDLQAYLFQDINAKIDKNKILDNFVLREAKLEDIEQIENYSGDFFENIEKLIRVRQIYIGYYNKEIASFGLIEKSKIYNNVASIGMYVIEEKRQVGLGRNTLLKLKDECYKGNYIPIAGCWYYNHNSKRTLESAGMYSQTRLINVYF